MQFDTNGWLDIAQEVDILENTFDRQGVQPKYIVLHGTAGGSSAEAVANYMKSTVGGSSPVSTHFVIGQDGHIVQCVPLSLAAWGNGVLTAGHATFLPENINPNLLTLASIEFVKASTDNSDALTAAQEASGLALIACICNTYGIPKRTGDVDGGIIRHADIDPVNRARCPGTFNYGKLWNYLTNGDNTSMIDLSNPTVASHFSGDNAIWTCKDNKFLIGHAILDFYRSFGGNSLCGLTYLGLPTSNETGITGKQGVTYQRFERGVLIYDPNHVIDTPPGAEKSSVYCMHIDSGYGMDPRVAQLVVQNAGLESQISTLKSENDQLKALLASSNLGQISTLGKQIADDVALIMKLVSVQ